MNQQYTFYCQNGFVFINGIIVSPIKALEMAVLCDEIDVIMHLETYVNSLFTRGNVYKAVNLAAYYGSLNVIRYFVEYNHFIFGLDEALQFAESKQHTDVIDYLRIEIYTN